MTDGSGGKATIVEGDQKRSNGVIHYVDASHAADDGGARQRSNK
jgi:hypothetical protein